MNRHFPFLLTLTLAIPISARAADAPTPSTTAATAAVSSISAAAIEKFGVAAKKYDSLKTLRVRWQETAAVGKKSIWELRWRKLSTDNIQVWVRGYDPNDNLTNTFVYDGKRYLHLRTDENELESEIMSPEEGLKKVLTASPTVFISWVPLLGGINFAADKDKVSAATIENGRVILDTQLPATQGLTRLGYGFDGANLMKDFSITRTVEGFEANLRWQVLKQEPDVALTDADFVLKAPPKPPKPKLSLKIDKGATASFAKATKLYGGLKSWSAIMQPSVSGQKSTPTEIDLVKPGQLRLVDKSVLPWTHYVNAGKHWILDTEDKTYQQATDDMKGKTPAAYVLSTAGALNREIGQWLLGNNPLNATFARQFYDGSISVGAKRLANAKLRGEVCERVLVTEIDPPDGPLAATTTYQTFWLRARDGALLRLESRHDEKGQDSFTSMEDFTQRFNPKLPASRFVFTAPKGYKQAK